MNPVESDKFLKCEPGSLQKGYKTGDERLVNFRQILGIILGSIHVINAGMTNGYASVILAQSKDNETIQITKNEESWIVSIAVIPMAPGCLLCGILLNVTRKKTLLSIITIVDILSLMILYTSISVPAILIGRFINGMANAMGATIIPSYLAEISHSKTRALFLSIVALGISLGILIVHVMGAFFTWQMCALIAAVFSVAYLALILYLPETYVWHLRNGNIEEAEKAFYWYRGQNATSRQELEKLLAKQHEQISDNYTKIEMLRLCCSKLLLMPLGIAFVGMATMHLSGSKAIMFYSISIVGQVIPSLNQYTSSILIDVVRTVMTCVGSVLVNKFPVRLMFIISGIGSAFSHFCFSVCFSYSDGESSSQVFSILSLFALISYTVFSSIGIAPLSWVIAGEIFPLIVKGLASGIFTFAYFITFFIVVKITPNLFELFGISGGFVFFGACTAIGTIIMYVILPETKNKTLKEIEELFR